LTSSNDCNCRVWVSSRVSVRVGSRTRKGVHYKLARLTLRLTLQLSLSLTLSLPLPLSDRSTGTYFAYQRSSSRRSTITRIVK
jgi:hypothetical protein